MYDWQKYVQKIVDEIDICIKRKNDEALSLEYLSNKLGYSQFYISRKFKEISGMQFRDYLRYRRLAFALKEVRDTDQSLLDIALNYGFSSNEAFTRAFMKAYGIAPSKYRQKPVPVVLRTILRPFDWEHPETSMEKSKEAAKTYFVTIPAHKFLHIRNYESIGY